MEVPRPDCLVRVMLDTLGGLATLDATAAAGASVSFILTIDTQAQDVRPCYDDDVSYFFFPRHPSASLFHTRTLSVSLDPYGLSLG